MIQSIINRLGAIVSIFLLIAQLIVLASYYGLIRSKPNLEEISEGFIQSERLMDSSIAEYMITPIAFGVLCILFISSLFKEVHFRRNKARLIWLNAVILVIFSVIFGVASQSVFLPITGSAG